jgi:cytochrome c-type biogenesis protein CcmH/NrfG
MSVTLLGCVLVVTSAVLSALLIFARRWDVARRGFLSHLQSSSRQFGLDGSRMWTVPAAVFALVAGVGAAVSYMQGPSEVSGSRDAMSSLAPSGMDGKTLARLQDYARSAENHAPAPKSAADKPLPDVNTMMERLAARLESAPEDIKGWRMLGWSYFNTGRYDEAAAAYAKAVKLDPNSSELKLAYEEAKAKAAGTIAAPHTEPSGNSGDGLHVAKSAAPEAMPPAEQSAAIRAMVDGLANRLESSPLDVEGWARLMRSRVVLGEREVAATELRKALEIFKDDQAATRRIKAAAIELGLRAE